MKIKLLFLFAALAVFPAATFSQETFPVNGMTTSKTDIYYAFTHATLVKDYKTIIPDATLLVKDDRIIAAGAGIAIPKGAVIVDVKGKYIYPSFIDLYSSYGMQPVKREPRDGPQMERKTKGPFTWNDALKPHVKAAEQFNVNNESAEEMRKLGFGAVLTHHSDGIIRGTAALVSLGKAIENEVVLKGEAAANYSFNKGSSTQDYPSSLMGSIALLRQTFYDAQWYKNQKQPGKEFNMSLEQLNRIQSFPQIFEVGDKQTALRADKVGDEFGIQYIIKGGGDEYQRINEIAKTRAKFILPLTFPDAYDVEDPLDALLVNLEQMKHWELAPYNAGILAANGIEYSFTLTGLKDKDHFFKNLTKAGKSGLKQEDALKALTYNPAKFLGVEKELGSLTPGAIANFFIASDSLYAEKFVIYENWVQGKPYFINDINLVDLRGNYDLAAGDFKYSLKVSGEPAKPVAEIVAADSSKKKVHLYQKERFVTLSFSVDTVTKEAIRLTGKVSSEGSKWDGKGQLADGKWIDWTATRKSPFEEKKEKDTVLANINKCGDVTCPSMAYGWKTVPPQEAVVIRNATLWTNEKDGIIKDADILIRDGKIAQIGQKLDVSASKTPVKEIDAKGKHVTPGIIDEHSHIAISHGVNEGGQALSSEVRIGDVINSDDVNIYRQLAGGVTAAQLLHGSANPIGGQSALIKLRWGMAPEDMKINGADGYIKFALGENVKQANWGEKNVIRYPQTRMGVEQVFYESFNRAKEYKAAWARYNAASAKEKATMSAPRRDLELDALAEILDKKRFITCHSYIQSEINMLMHVADSMGFKVNTFTHILEGYKVADKMKAHGVGASTFSDWWAYKFEVNDAIPFNAAILNEQGVVTAINSDDAEMARRLNQEAAKTVKYGGVSEEDAMKMVTLNPAKLLHLDAKMGSLKPGKDADVVLWSENPLSVYARAEKTFVDGICFYDRTEDESLRQQIASERARLVQKMLAAKKDGETVRKPEFKKPKLYHCDSEEEILNNW